LAGIDVASSLARLALDRWYTRPIINNSTEFEIVGGRHPSVEAIQGDSGGTFVSNDCNLTNKQFWLITGPNMGGKSTFLRQNAIIAILAQSGSFVPAGKARIGIVDAIFSRVGSADDLAHDRSTFMVEMIETAQILQRATSKSLVIMDEVGRGTATFDGLSIAWAVSEYLHNVNQCRTLFATHYHELTQLEEQLNKMACKALAVQEIDDNIVFLYKIVPGGASASYGIHVAKLAGLPAPVILRATEILDSISKKTVNSKVLEDIHKEVKQTKSKGLKISKEKSKRME